MGLTFLQMTYAMLVQLRLIPSITPLYINVIRATIHHKSLLLFALLCLFVKKKKKGLCLLSHVNSIKIEGTTIVILCNFGFDSIVPNKTFQSVDLSAHSLNTSNVIYSRRLRKYRVVTLKNSEIYY